MVGHEYWGIPGWHCAFILMPSVSLLIGALVYMTTLFVVDPRRDPLVTRGGDDDDTKRAISVVKSTAMRSVMKVQTFQVIVLQGIVGSLPWTAMVFFTMWFELIGFDNNSSTALNSLFAVGCAMGSFLGGFIADQITKHFPDSGQVTCAHFSAFMGIPFLWILLILHPAIGGQLECFCCHPCANNPMFTEVTYLIEHLKARLLLCSTCGGFPYGENIWL